MAVTINGTSGVTSPEVILDNATADGGQVVLKSSGYSNWNLDNYSGRFRAYYNATEYFTIDTSGNVGIGTSSPTQKLNVQGNVLLTNPGNSLYTYYDSTATWTGRDSATGAYVIGVASSERMRIDSSGNVGIGTSSPSNSAKVDAYGSIISTSATLSSFNANNAGFDFVSATKLGRFFATSTDTTGGIMTFTTGQNGTYSERMRITDAGEIWIAGTTDRGAYNLQCNGTGVWGAGAYTNGSDARIKDDITPIESCLEVVNKLNPVTYKYKENWSKDQSTQTGFIAQDLLEAFEGKNYVDGIVNQDSEYMSVAYQNIIPLLTKAIQEQQALITDLTTRLATLENK